MENQATNAESLPYGFVSVNPQPVRKPVDNLSEEARKAAERSQRVASLSAAVQVTSTPEAALEAAERFMAYISGEPDPISPE